MSSQSPQWEWDSAARRYRIYDARNRRWIWDNEYYASSSPGDARSSQPAATPQRRDNNDTVLLGRPVASQQDARPPNEGLHRSAINRQAGSSDGGTRMVAKDSKGRLETHWKIWPSQEYVDPKTGKKRSVTFKRIETNPMPNSSQRASNSHDNVRPGHAVGKIIEMDFMAPHSAPGISGKSGMASVTRADETDVVCHRRFVIVQEHSNGFRAAAISTYRQQGVSSEIKFHHAQIFTAERPQSLLSTEKPETADERPMQIPAIQAETRDRGRKLDPMSRLDYADITDFEWDNPTITVFGRVVSNSRKDLGAQFSIVQSEVSQALQQQAQASPAHPSWARPTQQIRPTDPAVPSSSAGSQSRSAAPLAIRPATQRQPNPSHLPQQGRVANAATYSSNIGPQSGSLAALPLRTAGPATTSTTGVSESEVTGKIAELKEYARTQALAWPKELSTRAMMERMRGDVRFYQSNIKYIASRLKEQKDAKDDSDEESSAEAEDSSENDD